MDHRTIVSFFTCQLVWVNRYGVLGVATLDYLPYMWLSFTCIIVTITLAYLGKGVNRVPVTEAVTTR